MPGLFAVCAVCAACTTQTPRPSADATLRPTDVLTPTPVDAGVELPEGQGRDILVSACLSCHDLGGLALFSGFYTRDDWRTLVLTMIETGATVDAAEVETVADYLARHFGPDLP